MYLHHIPRNPVAIIRQQAFQPFDYTSPLSRHWLGTRDHTTRKRIRKPVCGSCQVHSTTNKSCAASSNSEGETGAPPLLPPLCIFAYGMALGQAGRRPGTSNSRMISCDGFQRCDASRFTVDLSGLRDRRGRSFGQRWFICLWSRMLSLDCTYQAFTFRLSCSFSHSRGFRILNYAAYPVTTWEWFPRFG